MTDKDLNERKTFIKAVGMESTNFVNKTLFFFLASTIRTSDVEDGTDFCVRNGWKGGVKSNTVLHAFPSTLFTESPAVNVVNSTLEKLEDV